LKPLLQLSDIRKSFGAVRALKGVSFDLQPGEVHALLGENGAGKSTLIKVITGAHSPDDGTLTVAGESLRSLTPSHARELGIACIYQQPALFPDLSVAENIGLRLKKTSAFAKVKHFNSPKLGGVSLTVNAVEGRTFGLNIIPHTWEATTLGDLKPGDAVNLEIDMLARYLARWQETA
jgi:ABC-type branched-subunit amino acid transport system ATPase component